MPIKKKNYKPPVQKKTISFGKKTQSYSLKSTPGRKRRSNSKDFFRKAFYITSGVCAFSLLGAGFMVYTYFTAEPEKDNINIISRAEWGADESRLFIPSEDDPKTETDETRLETEKFNLNLPIYNQYPDDLKYHKIEESINGVPLRYAKYYSKPNRIVLHHTATSKPMNTKEEVSDYLRRLIIFHTNPDMPGTFYGDIGYHFLIDKNGNIYEGRRGGPEVAGAHVESANTGAIGISMIGNFHEAPDKPVDEVTPEALQSLKGLVYNLSIDYDIDLNESVEFLGQEIPAFAGHQDYVIYSSNPSADPESYTECPGDNLKSRIDDVRKYALKFDNSRQQKLYVAGGLFVVFILSMGVALFLKERV